MDEKKVKGYRQIIYYTATSRNTQHKTPSNGIIPKEPSREPYPTPRCPKPLKVTPNPKPKSGTLIVNPRKLEHEFRMTSAGIPYTLP